MTLIVAVDGSEPSTRGGVCRSRPARLVRRRRLVVTVVDLGDPMEVTGTGMAGGVMSERAFDERERLRQHDGGDDRTRRPRRRSASPAPRPRCSGAIRGRKDPRARGEDLGAAGSSSGRGGNGGLKRAVLGSVSDGIVRNAPVPGRGDRLRRLSRYRGAGRRSSSPARSAAASTASPTIPMSASVEHQRVGIVVDRQHRRRGADADHVVELAAAAQRTYRCGAIVRPVTADLARTRHPAVVGDLACRSELGAEDRAQRLDASRSRRV